MAKQYWATIYIDRNPNNLDEGWGWVELTVEDVRRFGLSTKTPQPRQVTKQQEITVTRYQDSVPYRETYINTYTDWIYVPSRGRSGAKKFTLIINDELVTLKAQKSLTIAAICAWLKTWVPPETKLMTPGKRLLSLNNERLAHQACFVYFILNETHQAIKIGWAKDLQKRMQSLQTASPVALKLVKAIQVDSSKAAQELEQLLHQQFKELRLSGEWFKAEAALLHYLDETR
ncbi:MAG: GIY-YIG nuclease family protein [Synechococcales cyanobacterium M58_A2018_015]|nr:GIY-YIG nuclease family protein [Synechococcales cyanobacterium M58_A2018_015]